jgi:hypothetical protein
MEKRKYRAAACLALVLVAGGVLAQADQPAATVAPQSAAGLGETTSAFAGYRPYRADEPLTDWRAANDQVGQQGGHTGHGQAEPAPESPQEHGR